MEKYSGALGKGVQRMSPFENQSPESARCSRFGNTIGRRGLQCRLTYSIERIMFICTKIEQTRLCCI